MKVKPAEIPSILKSLSPNIRAVLVFGRDEGLARERADTISKQIAPDLSDPFQVAKPSTQEIKDTPSLLLDEVSAISMMGGRRLVRVDGAGNETTPAAKLVLESEMGDGLLVMTGGDLKGTSSLRKLLEGAKNGLAIPCYEDSTQDLMGLIHTMLSEVGLGATQDAVSYLVENLGSDRMVSHGEIEKLIIYKGTGTGQVTLADAEACVGDTAALGINQIAEAVTGGDLVRLEKLMERARTSGENAIAILRTLQNRVMRLHLARGFMDQGMSVGEAVGKLRPPVFFSEKPRFQQELSRWPTKKLERALEILMEAELDCKTTGNPADVICARALLSIAKAAR